MSRFAEFQARFLAGTLTAADFEGITPEDSVKARMEAAEIHRQPAGEVIRAKSDGKRTHHFVMSSERPCGPYKDSVRYSAWNTEDFERQGSPLLWAHDGSQPPIGKVEKTAKLKTRKTLEGVVRFAKEGVYPFADLIARMVEEDIITNGSVGFQITDARPPTASEMKKEGLGQHSMVIEGACLREFSIVPVGADPNAVKQRGDEIRSALDGFVERGEADPELASHMAALLGVYEPLATRSIVVPEFSWRGHTGGAVKTTPVVPGLLPHREATVPKESIAMFGSDKGGEAFVPLPDGARIDPEFLAPVKSGIITNGSDDVVTVHLDGTDDFAERIEALVEKIEAITTERKTQEETLESLTSERADLATSVEELTLRLQEAEAAIERLENENAVLSKLSDQVRLLNEFAGFGEQSSGEEPEGIYAAYMACDLDRSEG